MRETTMHTHIHSLEQFRIRNEPNMHILGWWEEERTHPYMERTCKHTEKAPAKGNYISAV